MAIGFFTVIDTIVGMGVFLMMHVDKRIDDLKQEMANLRQDMDRKYDELKSDIREIRQVIFKVLEVPQRGEK